MNIPEILIGKSISFLSSILGFGNGSTWPGHVALKLNKNFINDLIKKNNLKIIFVIGTNGKTTTSKIIKTILDKNNINTIINSSGANLTNGIASSLLLNSNLFGKLNKHAAIFEIDENALSLISEYMEPDYLIALNLFRDQLDRYGEIDTIAKKWKEVITKYKNTKLILNADDPQITYLGLDSKLKTTYFGLDNKQLEVVDVQHGADSIMCPRCNEKLNFEYYYFSHLGKWNCTKCGFKRPTPDISNFSIYPLSGTYSMYNTISAVLLCEMLDIKKEKIQNALKEFIPAFGRQEEVIYKNKKIKLFLSKNPISFNESLSTVKNLEGKSLIFALNDKIPDGLDVSWIWDIDFERLLEKGMNIAVCGDRASDMSLRLKYADHFNHSFNNIEECISKMIDNLNENETLYILPNYSSMLEIRKIITGKEIL